jgi:TDG/mug DNA glycosylase family protein
MPGNASLRAKQYYAHPRNSFWRIIEELLGIPFDLPYEQRCSRIVQCGVGIWDVLKTCTRSGSLDSDIVESSIIPNDFQSFFGIHTHVRSVFFNGAKAEKSYEKHVVPKLRSSIADLVGTRLPSTSPANAALKFEEKLNRWRIIAE